MFESISRKYRHAIFDMDASIITSMPAWKNLGKDYLSSSNFSISTYKNFV